MAKILLMRREEALAPFGLLWLVLGLILATSAAIYNVKMGVPTFIAEFSVFLMICLMFYKPSPAQTAVATFGALTWMFNQYTHWYVFGDPARKTLFLWTSAAISLLLLIAALIAYYKSKSQKSGLEAIPIFIMLIYAVWKAYLDFVTYAGSIGAFSGGLWATGILLLSLSTLAAIYSPKTTAIKNACLILALIGLTISAYAAIAYGEWLVILR